MVSFYDLRYQRQAQASILEAEREKQANEAKSKFLANMSHEIRSPLVNITSKGSAYTSFTIIIEWSPWDAATVGRYRPYQRTAHVPKELY